MAKACASQGSRNTGPSTSRGILGTASIARRAAVRAIMSRRLKGRYPRLDRHLQSRIGASAPQFAAVEQHGIEPLRILALADRDAVREDVMPAHAFDHADAPSRVARQPGMRLGMD